MDPGVYLGMPRTLFGYHRLPGVTRTYQRLPGPTRTYRGPTERLPGWGGPMGRVSAEFLIFDVFLIYGNGELTIFWGEWF